MSLLQIKWKCTTTLFTRIVLLIANILKPNILSYFYICCHFTESCSFLRPKLRMTPSNSPKFSPEKDANQPKSPRKDATATKTRSGLSVIVRVAWLFALCFLAPKFNTWRARKRNRNGLSHHLAPQVSQLSIAVSTAVWPGHWSMQMTSMSTRKEAWVIWFRETSITHYL